LFFGFDHIAGFEVYLPEPACPVQAKVRQAGQEFEGFEEFRVPTDFLILVLCIPIRIEFNLPINADP
jgi:hypothetical protein